MNAFEKLLEVFDDSIKGSKGYRIGYLPEIGYVMVSGKYDPDAPDSTEAAFFLNVERVLRTPREMAEELLENYRWQWCTQHPDCVRTENYKSIFEMDADVPVSVADSFFPKLREYEKAVRQILQEDACQKNQSGNE